MADESQASTRGIPILYLRFLNFVTPALIILAAACLVTEYAFSEVPETSYPGAALLTWTDLFFAGGVVPGQLIAHRAAVIAQLVCSVFIYFVSPANACGFGNDCFVPYLFFLLVSTIFAIVNLVYFLNATTDTQTTFAHLYGYTFDPNDRQTIFPGVGSLISYIHGAVTALLFILAIILQSN